MMFLPFAPQSFTDKTTQFPLSDKSLAIIDQKQELSFKNNERKARLCFVGSPLRV